MTIKSALLSLAALGLLMAGPAYAADKPDDADSNVIYVPATLQNISKALFKKGILRYDDPAAVEEFVRIQQCGLYEEYYNNDFAWSRIRESAGREIQVSLKDYPDGLEVSSALPLGNYDLTSSEFQILDKAQMIDMGIIQVLDTEGGGLDPCPGMERASVLVPRMHPLRLSVKIDIPVELKSFPMAKAKADKYIAEMNKRITKTDEEKRSATLVMRIRLLNADPLASVTDPMYRTVLGLLDDLRIYDGPERKELLFRRDYLSQREKTQKQQSR